MERSSRILSVFVALGLLTACLFGSIRYHAFNFNYYKSEYAKLNTAENIGISEEGLLAATQTLLDYLNDQRQDISCVQNVKGIEREVFDQRESDHMIDVKNLYLNARMICLAIILLGVISLVIQAVFVKVKGYDVKALFVDLRLGFRQVILAFIIVVGFLLLSALIDFNAFWISFHQLFFRNDLWLLDPSVSIMINMFPEEFFFGMVVRIMLTFIVTFVGGCLVFSQIFKRTAEKFSIENQH